MVRCQEFGRQKVFLNAKYSLLPMVSARHHCDDLDMFTRMNTYVVEGARRRSGGFAWLLVYLMVVATLFNVAARGGVLLVSGLSAPVGAVVGISLAALLVAAFFAAIKGLRSFQ